MATVIDSHAHYYRFFNLSAYLETALGNLDRGARELGLQEPLSRALIVLEKEDQDNFKTRFHHQNPDLKPFQPSPTSEDCSITLSPRNKKLHLIAGRQIRTSEDLEVLALGSLGVPAAPITLHDCLHRVIDSGGIAIIPWGFGKWSFSRARLIKNLLPRLPAGGFWGDKNRPRILPEHRFIRSARRAGSPILYGSDPHPQRSQLRYVGSCGFALRRRLDEQAPFRSLREELLKLDKPTRRFGRDVPLAEFLRVQFVAQIQKRKSP